MRAALGRFLAGLMPPRAGALGPKLVLLLTAVALGGAFAITLLLTAIITPSFDELEGKQVEAAIDRTRAVLAGNLGALEGAARGQAERVASYAYLTRADPASKDALVSPAMLADLGVSGVAYVAPGRGVLVARWLDPVSHADRPALRTALVDATMRIDFPKLTRGRGSASFFYRRGDVVVAAAVAEVRRVGGGGPSPGWIVIARAISPRELSDLLGLAAQWRALDRWPPDASRHAARAAVPLAGADGRPVVAVELTLPRDVSVLGRRVLMLAVAGSTVLLLLVVVALRRIIARLVLRPLHRVERHMQKVRQSGSLGELQEDGRGDEIGSLGRSFNSMLRQLKDLREQIEVQSFALGKSESAVAVVHNVRNALNPISTILSQGVAQSPPIDRATLARVVAELAKDGVPPERRAKLCAFVTAAIEAEAAARAVQVRELEIGREAMSHALDIIGQQQRQAHERPVLEPCDVTALIARNATIARYGGDNSIGFTYPAAPCMVLANRVLLSQVIGNLFSNAAEAIVASGAGQGTIAVSVCVGVDVEVLIRDTGEGFDPATGRALFQRGFSTRPNKTGGLGLHWCANAMAAMEGALRLESDGRGKGATAILTLKRVEAVGGLAAAA